MRYGLRETDTGKRFDESRNSPAFGEYGLSVLSDPSGIAAGLSQEEKMEKKSDFEKRLRRHHDELRWLYMELYGNDDMFLNSAVR